MKKTIYPWNNSTTRSRQLTSQQQCSDGSGQMLWGYQWGLLFQLYYICQKPAKDDKVSSQDDDRWILAGHSQTVWYQRIVLDVLDNPTGYKFGVSFNKYTREWYRSQLPTIRDYRRIDTTLKDLCLSVLYNYDNWCNNNLEKNEYSPSLAPL